MSVSLSYTLDGFCTLEIDGAEVSLWATPLADTLDELVTATWGLVAHGTDETVLFVSDPGTYRLKLQPTSGRLALRVIEWDAIYARDDEASGRTIFQAECRLRTFAGAVLSCAQLLRKTHSEEAYRQRMRYRFPLERMEMLRQALMAKSTFGR